MWSITQQGGEETITKHIHDGRDSDISDLSDEANLLGPNGSWLDRVDISAAAGTPSVATYTVTVLNNVPLSGSTATSSPGIGAIWFQSDDGAAAPTLPAAVEAANVHAEAMAVPSNTTISSVRTNSDGSISEVFSFSGSNISFNNTFAAGVSQAYINCAMAAEQTIAAQWSTPNAVTLNESFTAQAEGQNGQLASNGFYVFGVSYATLKSALTTLASHEPANTYLQQAVAHLPASDPSGGVGFELALPYARMLGLTSASNFPDDAVTLNTSYSWSYGQDVTNTLVHEISEGGLGRIGGLGDQNSLWSVMDLFRYNSSGAADYTDGRDGQATYFSYNGGATLSSLSFNNEYSGGTKVNGGDTSDFAQVDVFGTGFPGEINGLSQTDIQVMETLGWSSVQSQVLGNVHNEAHGDFNSDGRPDSIWRDSNASATMWSYDATGQTVNTIGLGQVGFSWTIHGSGSYISASTSQMLVGSTDGTMALWNISSGALTGVNLGQRWSGIGYIDSDNYTAHGLDDLLVFNQADHHLYDWWFSNNQLQGVDLGAYWSNIGYIGKGQFTANGGTNFLVTNTADNHLYDWWITNDHLQGADLGPYWSNVAMVATGKFTSNGGTNFLVTNTIDHHLYDWWISSSGQLQGMDLGAYWSNISLIAVGKFDNNTTNSEFLVQNTVDHHLYEWWISPQGTLAGIDLGAYWNNIQLVDSGHFNNNGANSELLVRNTADGHFYDWWISNNHLQGVDLGLSAFASGSTSGPTASADPASPAAQQAARDAPPADGASTNGPAKMLMGNSGADNFTFSDELCLQNQAVDHFSVSEHFQQMDKSASQDLPAAQPQTHHIDADVIIGPNVNDVISAKNPLIYAGDFHLA